MSPNDEPKTIEEIVECIVVVGAATGAEDRARLLANDLHQRIDRVRSRAARLAERFGRESSIKNKKAAAVKR